MILKQGYVVVEQFWQAFVYIFQLGILLAIFKTILDIYVSIIRLYKILNSLFLILFKEVKMFIKRLCYECI